MASLKVNFVYQSAWQILLVLAPLVTTPYLSRVLGPDQIGVYSYTYAITNYFVMFATLGMSTYGVRVIAACGADRLRRSQVFWGAYTSQLCVGLIVCVAYAFYLSYKPNGGLVVSLVWGMWILAALLDVSWLFFGVEEFKLPTLRSIITKLFSVAIIFIFVRTSSDLWIYCAAIAGSMLANQVLLWPFVKRYVDFLVPRRHEIIRHFVPTLRLFIPVVAISLYTSMDKIMLGAISGMEQAGYYEYSEKLSKMPMAIITAMGTVMLPRMTTKLKAGARAEALKLLEKSIGAMLVMAFGLTFGIMAIAPVFAPVFLGEDFAGCAPIMCVLACVIPVISITNVLGRQYLLPTERDWLYTISLCIGAVVNVIINIILIPYMGAMGAAIGTVAAELSVLMAQSYMVHKELPLLRYFLKSIPFAVCGLLMMIFVRMISELLTPGLLNMFIEIFIGCVVYSVLAGLLILFVIRKNKVFRRVS